MNRNLEHSSVNSGSIRFLCEDCGTEDESRFARYRPNLCRDCKKNQRPYDCKECGDKDKENFREGRYGVCKKCQSMINAKQSKEKRRHEKYENLTEQEKEEAPVREVDFIIEKYLATDKKLMNGYSVREILENFSAYNLHKDEEDKVRDDEIYSLKEEICNIKYLMVEMMNLGKLFA